MAPGPKSPSHNSSCQFGTDLEEFPQFSRGSYGQGHISTDWFKGTFTGNHGFYFQLEGFPVSIFPQTNPLNICLDDMMIPRNLFHMFDCQTNDLHDRAAVKISRMIGDLILSTYNWGQFGSNMIKHLYIAILVNSPGG